MRGSTLYIHPAQVNEVTEAAREAQGRAGLCNEMALSTKLHSV